MLLITLSLFMVTLVRGGLIKPEDVINVDNDVNAKLECYMSKDYDTPLILRVPITTGPLESIPYLPGHNSSFVLIKLILTGCYEQREKVNGKFYLYTDRILENTFIPKIAVKYEVIESRHAFCIYYGMNKMDFHDTHEICGEPLEFRLYFYRTPVCITDVNRYIFKPYDHNSINPYVIRPKLNLERVNVKESILKQQQQQDKLVAAPLVLEKEKTTTLYKFPKHITIHFGWEVYFICISIFLILLFSCIYMMMILFNKSKYKIIKWKPTLIKKKKIPKNDNV
ncbi:hypothetical protein MrNuV_ORF095 [Macrobrachium rosenbergii nudivirus]|nr:hypothetical protein MrNuV_ORF095 [Macrobrachium rosenbergii nudivirus]